MSQDRKAASGHGDASLVERAEALLDEAVGQAAKGSYREAADKAQQALTIDPGNVAARDLLDSYRRQTSDDDERRRRRRSIAAAAAAIEEMVENDRLDEASSAIDALAMQFGLDAPVEDLRRRIAEARAERLDFDELDAAIDSIRVNDARPSHSGRGEPGGAIVAEVEEHLRAGRLDEASRAVSRLEQEPHAAERALKLRTRIEEATHVAAEYRREEEILIATAAIEERLRRGSIDDAAERLADLARRHGDSAPVAELGQRLAEARALHAQRAAVADDLEEPALPVAASVASPPIFQSMVEEEPSSGRTRSIAIAAAVVIALGTGAWWLMQRGDDAAPVASEPAASVASGSGDGRAPAGSLDPQSTATESMGRGDAADSGAAPPAPAAPAVASTAQQSAAAPPATGAAAPRDEAAAAPVTSPDPSGSNLPPAAASQDAVESPPVVARVPPSTDAPAPPPVEDTPNTSAPASADAPAPPASAPETTEVVVEAVPAAEIPPPPPVTEAAASTPSATDAPAPAEPNAAAPAPQSESAPAPAAETPADAVAEAPRAAPPPASTGPTILGCGDPGVVCVKALQVPTPRYPAAARARRLSGDVVVMALVNEQGRVVQARVDSPSFAFFNDAALDAARRATFQPATRQGVAGQSWARLTFKFEEQ